MTYLRIVAWDVIGRGIRRILVVAALFFASTWVLMASMGAAGVGDGKISYVSALWAALGIWAVVLPVVWVANKLKLGHEVPQYNP